MRWGWTAGWMNGVAWRDLEIQPAGTRGRVARAMTQLRRTALGRCLRRLDMLSRLNGGNAAST